MSSRLTPSPNPAWESRSLVPRSLDAPLGVLDVSTLRLLLSSTQSSSLEDEAQQDNSRPTSSELARAYGVDSSSISEKFRSPRGHKRGKEKRARRPVAAVLEPIKVRVPPFRGRHTVHLNQQGNHESSELVHSRRDALCSQGYDHVDGSVRLKMPKAAYRPSHCLQRRCGDDELRQEIQWIQTHFPVRRLANPKCSLALRCELFVNTLSTNLNRFAMRRTISQWKSFIQKQKKAEATKLRAFNRIVKSVEHMVRDRVANSFFVWFRWVLTCQELERLAAAISLQDWLLLYRSRREARVRRTEIATARAVAIANAHARTIQRYLRAHMTRLHLTKIVNSVSTIQRFYRSVRRRHCAYREQMKRRQLEDVLAHVRREEQLQFIIERTRNSLTCRITQQWRRYAAWREQLAVDYVASIVDQIEFHAAVMSIQSHIRGYQCRFRMKREVKAVGSIQKAWRQHISRLRAREARMILNLRRNMAARCLQQTFRRNHDWKKYRTVMAKSSRPMFLRALHESQSFRTKYLIPIIKSAVSVIQSAWRQHLRHVKWKSKRDSAVRRIQHWFRRVWVVLRWQSLVQAIWNNYTETRRQIAASVIQRWHKQRRQHRASLSAFQFMELIRSVVVIQQFFRRKTDRWRRLSKLVLTQLLPLARVAVNKIQKCWRAYLSKKRELLAQFRLSRNCTFSPLPKGIHELQSFLLNQRREFVRREAAATTIQKATKQWVARREGKLSMKRYRVLFQKELRRKAQRQIIHAYLAEKQHERTKRKKPEVELPSPAALSTHSTTTPSPTEAGAASATSRSTSPMTTRAREPTTEPSDGSDVVRCWSEEHQCFYWYNPRTGESSWC